MVASWYNQQESKLFWLVPSFLRAQVSFVNFDVLQYTSLSCILYSERRRMMIIINPSTVFELQLKQKYNNVDVLFRPKIIVLGVATLIP